MTTFSQSQVERPEALSNGRHERALEPDRMFVDRLDDGLGDAHRAVGVSHRGHVNRVPDDGNIGRCENSGNRTGNRYENPTVGRAQQQKFSKDPII